MDKERNPFQKNQHRVFTTSQSRTSVRIVLRGLHILAECSWHKKRCPQWYIHRDVALQRLWSFYINIPSNSVQWLTTDSKDQNWYSGVSGTFSPPRPNPLCGPTHHTTQHIQVTLGGKAEWAWSWTSHIHLVPMLRLLGTMFPLPHTSLWHTLLP